VTSSHLYEASDAFPITLFPQHGTSLFRQITGQMKEYIEMVIFPNISKVKEDLGLSDD